MVLRYVLALSLSLALPAAAQQRVVVPEGAAVAVPARGGPVAPRVASPPPRRARPLPPALPAADPGLPAAVALVPLAAAAAVAAAIAGGGGNGVSAPVRTR